MNVRKLFLAPIIALLLVACATHNTTVTPPSPQQAFQGAVLRSAGLLEDAANGAVKSAIQLRDAGKITQADNLLVQKYATVAADLGYNLKNEVLSADDLTTQKIKCGFIVQAAVFPSVEGSNIAALLANTTTLVLQIQAQVAQQ